MPNVIVSPIQRINVVTNQSSRRGAVHSTAQFIGAVNPDISGAVANAAAAIIILLIVTFVLNGIAMYLRNRWQRKVKW